MNEFLRDHPDRKAEYDRATAVIAQTDVDADEWARMNPIAKYTRMQYGNPQERQRCKDKGLER